MNKFDLDPRTLQRGEAHRIEVPRSGESIMIHTPATGFYVINQEKMERRFMGSHSLNITSLAGTPIARKGELENGRVFYREPNDPNSLGNRLYKLMQGQEIFIGLDRLRIEQVRQEIALIDIYTSGRFFSAMFYDSPRAVMERMLQVAARAAVMQTS
jgi:hypothetical protein